MNRRVIKGEIIAIGNELLKGVAQDTNIFFLAQKLTQNGFHVQYASMIPDDEGIISEYLNRSLKRSQFVIVTGGLGPTTDDKTTSAVARTFHLPLKRDPVSWGLLKDYAQKYGFVVDGIISRMAKLPEGAVKLDKETPKAGFFFEREGIPLYFLPGVPDETRHLFSEVVLKDLCDFFPTRRKSLSRLIKIFGLRESEIEKRLHGVMHKNPETAISFLPRFPENHLHISVREEEIQKAREKLKKIESHIAKCLGKYIIGFDDDTLEGVVGKLLCEEHSTVSVAESCTGGFIGHRFTNVSGSSEYFSRGIVAYSNEAKKEHLKIKNELLLKHGAVSEQVAKAMAEGIRKISNTTYGLATTGIAGPTGGTSEKPVGTVFIGLAAPEKTFVNHYLFHGSRMDIKILTSETALDILRRLLLGLGI